MKKIHQLRNKKGFTLVELIVVIVIITILSAALVTSLVGYINKARGTTALVEGNNILVAAQSYISENAGEMTVKNGIVDVNNNEAMFEAINDYLGSATEITKNNITAMSVNEDYAVISMTYKATNGTTVVYDAAKGGWQD